MAAAAVMRRRKHQTHAAATATVTAAIATVTAATATVTAATATVTAAIATVTAAMATVTAAMATVTACECHTDSIPLTRNQVVRTILFSWLKSLGLNRYPMGDVVCNKFLQLRVTCSIKNCSFWRLQTPFFI